MKFHNSKKVLMSAVLSSLFLTNLYADINENNININLIDNNPSTVSYNDINKRGSLINSNFNFYELPNLEIVLTKGYFDETTNTSNLLFKVKNTSSDKVDAHKFLDLSNTAIEGTLEPKEEKYIIVTRDSLNNYLTKIGNEKFLEQQAYIKRIQDSLTMLENDFKSMKTKLEQTELELQIKTVKVNEYKTNEDRIHNGLDTIINNFSKSEIDLGIQQLFGQNLAFETLDLNRKYSLIVVLINNYVDSLAKYRINIKVSELIEKDTLLTYKSIQLEDELKMLQTSVDEFKKSLKEVGNNVDKREEFLLEAVIIYKNRLTEINNLKLEIDNLKNENLIQKQKISELENENTLLKTKLYNDTLDVEKSRIDLLEDKIKSLTKENSMLNQDNKDRQYQNSLTLEKVSGLEQTNETLIEENKKLQKKIDELKQEVIEIRTLI